MHGVLAWKHGPQVRKLGVPVRNHGVPLRARRVRVRQLGVLVLQDREPGVAAGGFAGTVGEPGSTPCDVAQEGGGRVRSVMSRAEGDADWLNRNVSAPVMTAGWPSISAVRVVSLTV